MHLFSFIVLALAIILNDAVSATEGSLEKPKLVGAEANETVTVGSRVQALARARPYFISNRDSYVNAASSVGSSHGHAGSEVAMSSYQVPQNSYNAPWNHGYAQQQQQAGYGMQSGYGGGGGWGAGSGDDSQSSKGGGADLLGLIGLIGLKGLKGTIPLIKKAVLVFIALLPIIIPLLIIKLPILLLKPVITFGLGRDFSVGGTILDSIFGSVDQITKELEFIERLKFNETLASNGTILNEVIDDGIAIGNDIIGKGVDNRCMQRIACEGVFKSLPRIFFRLMGDSHYILPKQRDKSRVSQNENHGLKLLKVVGSEGARRKDLATLAVNKLKNSQYLTKTRPITDDIIKTEEVCKQYKCSELF